MWKSNAQRLLIIRKLLILLSDERDRTEKTESLGTIWAQFLIHFPALFSRQFAFCVALIFFLAAALIFRFAFPRLPPKAAIAATIPPSFFASCACSLLERGKNVHGASARILSRNSKGPCAFEPVCATKLFCIKAVDVDASHLLA